MAIPQEALARLLKFGDGAAASSGGFAPMAGGGRGMASDMPDLTSANLRVTDYGPGAPNPTGADTREFTGIRDIPLTRGSAALQPGTAKKFGLRPGDPFMYRGSKYFYHDQPAAKVGDVLDVYNPSGAARDTGPSWGSIGAPLSEPMGGIPNVAVDPTGANIGYAPGTYTGELGAPGDPGASIYDPNYGAGLKDYQQGGVAHRFNPRYVPEYDSYALPPPNRDVILPTARFYNPGSTYALMAQSGGVIRGGEADDRGDLLRDADDAFWGNQPRPSPTPKPTPTPRRYADGGEVTRNPYGDAGLGEYERRRLSEELRLAIPALSPEQTAMFHQAVMNAIMPQMQTARPIYTAQMLAQPPAHASGYFGELGGQIRPQVEQAPPTISSEAVRMLGGEEPNETGYAQGGVVNVRDKPPKTPKVPKAPKAPKTPKQQSDAQGFQFGPPGRYQQPQPEANAQATIPKEFMNYLANGGLMKEFTPDHHLMFSLGMKYAMSPKQAAKRLGTPAGAANPMPP